MIRNALHEAIEAEGQRLLEQAYQMRPLVTDDFVDATAYAYAAFVEYGQPPNTVESTVIVIDENVKALPAPQSETHS